MGVDAAKVYGSGRGAGTTGPAGLCAATVRAEAKIVVSKKKRRASRTLRILRRFLTSYLNPISDPAGDQERMRSMERVPAGLGGVASAAGNRDATGASRPAEHIRTRVEGEGFCYTAKDDCIQ
jgi:hypothetical protein